MMKYFLAALLTLIPAALSAQTVQDGFVRPPDVPAYVEKFNGYAAGTAENTVGDGSTTRGGTMPVLATMPADIPSTASGWVNTGTGDFVTITNPNAEEAKFRTVADMSHCAKNDPIRNFGAPGASHMHCFFGNTQTNAFTTYASSRTRANAMAAAGKAASTIAGGPYNASSYWYAPPVKQNAFGDGKAYIVKASDLVVYYVQNPANRALSEQRIPRGLRYVFGTNMDDPYDTIVKSQIAAANAQTGTSGRYAYAGNGFVGWKCMTADKGTIINNTVDGTGYYPAFRTAAGADPWGGNCTAGMWMVAELNGPNCFDGTNLWSPGGYKHFRRLVTDTVSTRADKGCPRNWYQLASLSITFWFKAQGFSDYGTWDLSCTAMATARAQAINPAAPALRPGECFHTDWLGGWDDTTFMKWQNFCFGVGGGTMHTCANSTISATEKLQGGEGGAAPDGSRNPQVNDSDAYTTLARSDMVQVPGSVMGPHTIHLGPPAVRNTVLISEGDSISVRGGPTHIALYADNHANTPTFTFYGNAVGSSTVCCHAGNSVEERKTADLALHPTHMTVLIGANDMTTSADAADPTSQPTAWLASLWSYTDSLRAQGVRVAAATLLPQCYPSNTTFTNAWNRRRAVANTAIRGAIGTHIDAVIDFAANTDVGDDADACDTAKYPDGLHPAVPEQTIMYATYLAAVTPFLAY